MTNGSHFVDVDEGPWPNLFEASDTEPKPAIILIQEHPSTTKNQQTNVSKKLRRRRAGEKKSSVRTF